MLRVICRACGKEEVYRNHKDAWMGGWSFIGGVFHNHTFNGHEVLFEEDYRYRKYTPFCSCVGIYGRNDVNLPPLIETRSNA